MLRNYLISLLLILINIIWGTYAFCIDVSSSGVVSSNSSYLGEQMYRNGILPSGKPMQAYIKGDVTVSGTSFSCSSCHMRSGLGSFEGGVNTPPTNGRYLYQQRDLPGSGNNRRNSGMNMAAKKKGITPLGPLPARPAYSDTTLADLLRGGKDPSGRTLDPVMPWYDLNDEDMAILVSYLEQLSMDYSPGVDGHTITFATVIADNVAPEHVDAMMKQLDAFVTSANKQQEAHEAQLVRLRETRTEQVYRRVKLVKWLVKGSPDTWKEQLETYYRNEPVFALVSGIAHGAWQPVHDFCEQKQVPSLLPITDYPVVTDNGRYTLYFSKGFIQEGEAAGRFLLRQTTVPQRIVQLASATPQASGLAAGFRQVFKDAGKSVPSLITLKQGEQLTEARLLEILNKERPDALAVWAGSELMPLLSSPQLRTRLPATVLVSYGYLCDAMMTVPEALREKIHMTFPYRLPQHEQKFDRLFSGSAVKNSDSVRVVKSKTMTALRILTQALKSMKGNFYREYLFDVISMMPDIELPLYERLSFGPEQFYASKGCYIVRFDKGDKPALVPVSDWVTH